MGIPLHSNMNSITESYVNFSFALLIMMTALAYTFWSMTDWPDAYNLVPSAATVFEQDIKTPTEVAWEGNQVVAKLYRLSEEEIPIEVDGRLFQSEMDVMRYQQSIPLHELFTQTIVLNSNGEVTKIVFLQQ